LGWRSGGQEEIRVFKLRLPASVERVAKFPRFEVRSPSPVTPNKRRLIKLQQSIGESGEEPNLILIFDRATQVSHRGCSALGLVNRTSPWWAIDYIKKPSPTFVRAWEDVRYLGSIKFQHFDHIFSSIYSLGLGSVEDARLPNQHFVDPILPWRLSVSVRWPSPPILGVLSPSIS